MAIISMAFDAGAFMFDLKRCVMKYRERTMVIYSADEEYHMTVELCCGDNKDKNYDYEFDLVHEFLYMYGWANEASFHYLDLSVMSGNEKIMLSKQGPLLRIRKIPLSRIGFDKMLNPCCNEKLKTAIALFNDGSYTDDKLYAILCFYKVVDLFNSGYSRDVVAWINGNINDLDIHNSRIKKFLASVKDKGAWLKDCRNRVAHLVMYGNGEGFIPGKSEELLTINMATLIMKELAKTIIRQNMKGSRFVPIEILDKK